MLLNRYYHIYTLLSIFSIDKWTIYNIFDNVQLMDGQSKGNGKDFIPYEAGTSTASGAEVSYTYGDGGPAYHLITQDSSEPEDFMPLPGPREVSSFEQELEQKIYAYTSDIIREHEQQATENSYDHDLPYYIRVAPMDRRDGIAYSLSPKLLRALHLTSSGETETRLIDDGILGKPSPSNERVWTDEDAKLCADFAEQCRASRERRNSLANVGELEGTFPEDVFDARDAKLCADFIAYAKRRSFAGSVILRDFDIQQPKFRHRRTSVLNSLLASGDRQDRIWQYRQFALGERLDNAAANPNFEIAGYPIGAMLARDAPLSGRLVAPDYFDVYLCEDGKLRHLEIDRSKERLDGVHPIVASRLQSLSRFVGNSVMRLVMCEYIEHYRFMISDDGTGGGSTGGGSGSGSGYSYYRTDIKTYGLEHMLVIAAAYMNGPPRYSGQEVHYHR